MAVLTRLPGDPATLASAAKIHQGVADLILRAARGLDRVVDDHSTMGKSVDAVRGDAATVAGSLRTAHPRYEETALALGDYAVKLQDAQQAANAAIAAYSNEESELATLYHRRTRIQQELRDSLMVPTSVEEREALLNDNQRISHQIAVVDGQAAAAIRQYESAVSARDYAALVAINRIRPALSELNDSVLEKVGAALQDLADFVSAVADWIAKFLTTVLIDIILIAVALVVVVIVLSLALSMVGLIIGLLLLTGAIGPADLQGLLNVLVSTLLVLIPVLVPGIYLVLGREAVSSTPEMEEITLPVVGQEHRRAVVVDGDERRTAGEYEDAFLTNGTIDERGNTESTVVSIIQVMNSDGTPRLDSGGNPVWRVTFPSTQDWQITGDPGAMNDLGSNLALMMTPNQQAAYERAMIAAMHQAGIGPEDSVMLVGFSQGGILAGKLASTDPQPFNITAIAVAGSPIDAMHIPDSVSVLSLQHPDDPVHQLDGASHTNNSNWVTITAAKDEGAPAHGASSYASTAGQAIDSPGASSAVTDIVDKQSVFFSDNEVEHLYEGHE